MRAATTTEEGGQGPGISVRWLLVIGLAAGFAAVPGEGRAFCVANNTNVQIHTQSLSSKDFEADIEAKAQACCQAPT